MALALLGVSIPNFVLGPVLVLRVLAHAVLAAAGAVERRRSSRVLPVLTLSTVYVAYIARLTRGGMLEMLRQDYIRTARAKGLSESRRDRASTRCKLGILPVVSLPRPGGGAHRDGLDRGREHLRDARARPVPRERGVQPRLHAGAGRRAVLRRASSWCSTCSSTSRTRWLDPRVELA